MSNDKLNKLFKDLKNDFDIEVPNAGHQERFLKKLQGLENKKEPKPSNGNYWRPFLSIAASLVIMLGLFFGIQTESSAKDLASVSPEMAKTQSFFASTIASELDKINNESSPETKKLVEDALKQLEILEGEYESLKVDLSESGDDQRVIYAMISNFQNRIELLQNVLEKIEEVKQLKQNENENSTTI